MTTRKRVGLVTPPEVTVEQIIIGGSDVVNFPAPQGAGIAQGNVLTATIGTSSGGFSTVQGQTTVTTTQAPGVEVVHTSIDLVSRQYVNVATQSAGGDWENVANSQGAPDGSSATLTEGLVLTQGTLIGDTPNFVDKFALTITKVEMVCWYAVNSFLLAGTTLQIQYREGPTGLPVTVKTISGGITSPVSENHLSTPETFDITASGSNPTATPWAWTTLNGFQSLFNGTMLVDVGLASVQVDAVRLIVTANLTEAI